MKTKKLAIGILTSFFSICILACYTKPPETFKETQTAFNGTVVFLKTDRLQYQGSRGGAYVPIEVTLTMLFQEGAEGSYKIQTWHSRYRDTDEIGETTSFDVIKGAKKFTLRLKKEFYRLEISRVRGCQLETDRCIFNGRSGWLEVVPEETIR